MDISHRQPRELIEPDLLLVADAAAILEVRPFDLFRAAWQNWYGGAPNERRAERVFVDYMFRQRVPFWVRHFAKRALREAEAGPLDREALGLAGYPTQEPLPDLGDRYLTLAYIAALLLLLLSAHVGG